MRHQGRSNDVVFEIDLQPVPAAHLLEQVDDGRAVQVARLAGHAAEQVGEPDHGHAKPLDHLAGPGDGTVAALLGCQIDDHRALLHALDHALGEEHGCAAAGDQRRGDDDVDLHRLLGEQGHLGLDEGLAHLLGVAAAPRSLLLEVKLKELGAHASDLLGDLGTGVEGLDDGTESASGADRGQPGHARAHDQHLRGQNGVGGGHLTAEELREMMGGLDDGSVPDEIGHGAQGVHPLGAGGARDAVHGDGRRPGLGELFEHLRVLRRPEEADQQRPGLHQVRLVDAELGVHLGRPYFEDDVGVCPDAGGVRERRARRRVRRIVPFHACPGAALDDHVEAQPAEAHDDPRGRSGSLFRRVNLPRNAYSHTRLLHARAQSS